MSLDLINALFEFGMALTICLSGWKLHKEKSVRGFHWSQVAFPTAWGIFNLFYYPSLGQNLSFFGGVAVVTCNLCYLSAIWTYRDKGDL